MAAGEPLLVLISSQSQLEVDGALVFNFQLPNSWRLEVDGTVMWLQVRSRTPEFCAAQLGLRHGIGLVSHVVCISSLGW